MHFDKEEIIEPCPSNWSQFVHDLRRFFDGKWIFRALGSWRKDPPVTSSFDDACERRTGKSLSPAMRPLWESWMLLGFKRAAHRFLPLVPDKDDFLEWLALARHYEMPSRLVDFSYSFFVALYFAISERRPGEDACIIALNLKWLKDQTEEKLKHKRYLNNERSSASFHNPGLFKQFAFGKINSAWYERIDEKGPCYKEEPLNWVAPVNPLRLNPRLASQKGLFLCQGDIRKMFDNSLTATLGGQKNVKALIKVPSKLTSEAIVELGRMNISIATLYPDLSGLAQQQRELVHEDTPLEDKRFCHELVNAIDSPLI